MPLSRDEFTQQLTASGLMDAAAVTESLSSLPPDKQPQDGEALARELVKQKKLTKFQAEQLYARKGKSLTLGNYVILDKLGQGGMGMVLKAKHTRMGRLVALKVMSPAALKSPDAVKRFHREVQAAAKLEHPNIVTAYDADEAHGTHFLVMQFIDGNDLSELVKTHGPLPIEQAVRCILQAARGLEFAHEQGVIHRDIKPANLLIDKKGTVKILDMGLARIDAAIGGSSEGAGLTNTGAIMGTVDYMPPEQAMDAKHADARSDIYSLGISLYYLLTGHVAYGGDTMMKKLMAHRESPIPSIVEEQRRLGLRPDPDGLAAGRDGVPTYERLDAVFRRMVAKRPEDRLQTMTQVIAELERCLPGSPTMASGSSANSSGSGDGAASGNELQQFLRQISGEESTTTTKTNPSVSKATAVVPSSRDAETKTSATGGSGTDSQSEATMVLEQSGEPMCVSPRTVRGLMPSGSPGGQKKKVVLLGSVAAAVVMLLVIVFALRGKSGTLHLEIKDDLIEVTIGDTGRVVKGVTEQDLPLPVGEHVLHVKREDLAFDTDAFELKQGEPVSITVERVGRRVRAMQGSTLLGHKESPKSKDKSAERPITPDFALEFALSGRSVEIPLASLDPNQPWTLEGYIQPADVPNHNQGLPAIFGGDVWRINLNHWTVRLVELPAPFAQGVPEYALATSTVESLRGKRFHVAAVYADKLAQLFINGKLVGGAPSKFLPKQNLGKLTLGARFQGTMDEWRISKVGRYGKDFTPPKRYEPDADTLALYHFDEGTGDVLKDSSGNNHHGQIIGAKWVRVDGGTVNSDGPDRRAAKYVLSIGGAIVIRENGQDKPIAAVGDLPGGAFELKAVELVGNQKVNDAGLAHFQDCQNLTHLNLGETPVSNAGLVHFKNCKNLGQLILHNTKVSDAGLAHFKDCKNLNALDLRVTGVSDAGLAHFKDLQSLTILELDNTQVSDAGLAIFKHCHNLTLLQLAKTKVSDAGLANFQNCQKLTNLNLTEVTQMTDAGLAHFKNCHRLTSLLLSHTQVSDTGLADLANFSNLRNLHISNTKVTEAGVKKLRAALPECQIESDITTTPKSIDLLPLVDVQRDAGVGNWKRIVDGVACENPNGANVLQLPYEPPEAYDFEIEFTTTGTGLNVNQYVAASGQMFSWKLDFNDVNPPMYGFQLLEGKFGIGLTTRIPDKIKDGQRYRSTVEVRRGSLRALLDGKELVKWTGDLKLLHLEPKTPMKHPGRIGIGSWRRPVTFHSVTVREVSGPGKLLAAETGWLDVLPLIDPQRDKLEYPNLTGKNDWQMRGGELHYTGDAKNGKLVFPVKIIGPNVEVEFEVTRTSGMTHINVDLPSLKGPIPIELSRSGSIVQLGWPAVVVGKYSAKLGQRITYLCKIAKVDQQDVIDVFADGVSIGHWQGQRDAIGKPDPVKYPQATSSGFWTYPNTNWTIHRVRLRAPGGSVEPINTAAVETGWLELFNGKDLTGWQVMGVKGWTVEQGVLLGKVSMGGKSWLMSEREFGDFELDLEYKLGPGSNSGIFLRAWPEGDVSGKDFREIQLLDDESPGFASQPTKNRTGSLFGLVAPDVAPKVPANQWHRVRVHLQGQQLQLTINDVAVLKHTLTDLRPSGRIGLQLYPNQVEFRNVRVRSLGPK